MQISTLNKILSLFISGCIGFLSILILFSCKINEILKTDQFFILLKEQGISSSVIYSAIAISLIMLLGSIITGFAQCTMRFAFYNLSKYTLLIGFLGQTRQLELMNYWKDNFSKNLKKSQYYSDFKNIDNTNIASIGASLLFHHGNVENIRWATTHHATYMLSTNFIASNIILFISIFFHFEFSPDTMVLVILVFLLINYFLLVLASYSYFFTYECVYRFSALIVSEKLSERIDQNVEIDSHDLFQTVNHKPSNGIE